MSLATRCTDCNTVFRVVQDQLKVSEGWVRCGRCGSVFNALEGLFDLEPVPAPAAAPVEREPEAPATPAAVPPTAAAAQAEEPVAPPVEAPVWSPVPGPFTPSFASAPAAPEPYVDAWPAPREPEFVESQPEPFARGTGSVVHVATPASRVDEEDRIDFADARFNLALLQEEGIAAADSSLDPVVNDDVPLADAAGGEEALPAAAAPAPEFLRKAERDARWASPRVRFSLALASVLLLGLLAVQAALHYRDLVATLLPESRPALEALCDVAGCRIEPLRRIDDIVIESSALNALPGGDMVRLSVVLRNRGVFPLAMPAIELTLTDAGGQMIARRVLPPADFGVSSATVLPAASEAPMQLVLTTSGRRASGYTVEPFYP
jgi:predicted Zn finger-like uncharacterized protein